MIHHLYHNPALRHLLECIAALGDKPLSPPARREEELVANLRAQVAALHPPASGDLSPSECVWLSFVQQFADAVRNGDPREFLRWPVTQKAMFVSNQPYLAFEFLALRFRADWRDRWRPALRESAAGHPVPFAFDWHSSGNLIHHAYHLAQFDALTKRRPEQFSTVIEFGGGYGSMCRLFHRLGFGGRYFIFDLPPFCILQQFYLRLLDMPVRTTRNGERRGPGIWCLASEGELDVVAAGKCDDALFLGTWSISETPRSVRDRFMHIAAACRGILIAYWRRFEEMDNVAYFTSWTESHPEFQWAHMAIPTLPDHFYLFGTR